ncbi:hypothetical protein USB125703_00972 [Pseudoclavibacter triregionum]|nr:hypothetical protein USB125703_00972 [Pseudoclavibacter triregionum]
MGERTGQSGSPPLARGAPQRGRGRQRGHGITPARAGSTRSPTRSTRSRRDHPRSRGEHEHVAIRDHRRPGSPPLARGAPVGDQHPAHIAGITPARAGSTACAGRGCRWRRDHPRSRGEHAPRAGPPGVRRGSPPLARGAQIRASEVRAVQGITPARAGSTWPGGAASSSSRDHPRSRGEHRGPEAGAAEDAGSPPLARGARAAVGRAHWRIGITPARAGSTASWCRWGRPSRDHPRSRGEHVIPDFDDAGKPGSPPLARGAHGKGGRRRVLPGITPARAGSTSTRRSRPRWPRDHPRSRGEHSNSSRNAAMTSGSPPLARGAQGDVAARSACHGITPARAGSTLPDQGVSGQRSRNSTASIGASTRPTIPDAARPGAIPAGARAR